MSYAKSRLFLGMTTVGTIVLLSTGILSLRIHEQFNSYMLDNIVAQVGILSLIFIFAFICLFPFDVLGGFLIPKRYSNLEGKFEQWLIPYIKGIAVQFIAYVMIGVVLINLVQYSILLATLGFVGLTAVILQIRNWVISKKLITNTNQDARFKSAIENAKLWLQIPYEVHTVSRADKGFTGGIIGIGRSSKILIPEKWLSFDTDVLATIIARRAIAISSYSHTTSIVLAFICNATGFLLANLLTQSPIGSLGWLLEFLCWFNIWTFLSLLVLPTFSRMASASVDRDLVALNVPSEAILNSTEMMNALQDNERSRSTIIETIFHPIPSVNRRLARPPIFQVRAWQIARTSLFLSGAGLSLLTRAVHCNVGRPDLWLLLPSD